MKIYLIAGEPSGDMLGARLMHALKELAPEAEFAGVGGENMKHQRPGGYGVGGGYSEHSESSAPHSRNRR